MKSFIIGKKWVYENIELTKTGKQEFFMEGPEARSVFKHGKKVLIDDLEAL